MSLVYDDDTMKDVEKTTKRKIKEPDKYKVLLHNDNYTTMDFVVHILCAIFKKSVEDATVIMLSVHNSGIGVCGVYTQEIAEAKVHQVHREAQAAGFPLKCSMEKND